MIFQKSFLLLCGLSTLALVACETPYSKPKDLEEAKYWQRKNASSALYLQGPKAQQMLHQNISNCVTEISELENLGEIRRAIPTNYNSGNTIEPRTASQQNLDEWDTPERDGYLYNEHMDYHDFETCMVAKGWERVDYLPYSAVDKANADYLARHGRKQGRSSKDRENVTTLAPRIQNPAPYKNLNE